MESQPQNPEFRIYCNAKVFIISYGSLQHLNIFLANEIITLDLNNYQTSCNLQPAFFHLKLLFMTPNLLERVQVYLLFQTVTRYCMIYLGNSTKLELVFRINYIFQKSDIEHFKNSFLFYQQL